MPIIVIRALEIVCSNLPKIANELERIANELENKEKTND